MSSDSHASKTKMKNAFVVAAVLLVALFALALRSFMLKPYDKSKLIYTEPTSVVTAQPSTTEKATDEATANTNGFHIVTKEASSTASSSDLSSVILKGYWFYLSTTRSDQFYRYAFTKDGKVLKDCFEKDYYRFHIERKYVIIEREKFDYSVDGNSVTIIGDGDPYTLTYDISTGILSRTYETNGKKHVEEAYRHKNHDEYIDAHWVLSGE